MLLERPARALRRLAAAGGLLAAFVATLCLTSVAFAQNPIEALTGNPTGKPAAAPPAPLGSAWDGFLDPWHLLDTLGVYMLAAVLGAVIAYHPSTRKKASTIEELEQPKTFIMYSLVGAISAIVAQVNSTIAFVIFGIGGLMRFRTDVGPAKDTGRVILVTIVGVCCGLKLFGVGVLATGFAWLVVWYLERESYSSLVVHGVDKAVMGQAADAYRTVLGRAGCRVLGEKKNFVKGNFTLIFTSTHALSKDDLERTFASTIPGGMRGSVDFDVS